MAATSRLGLCSLVLLVLAASTVTALRCYSCNSNDNSECFAPPKTFTEEEYRDNRTVPGRLLRECPLDDKGRKPFCRSMHVLVLGGSLPDHTRVLRECGYEAYHRPCYNMENGGHEEIVCQCSTDGCNGGSHLALSGVVSLLTIGLLARLLQRSV
uniref:Uncharacterized protein n=1 Tax=Anopheles dirus TaxID=7168 RepID=A0A182NUD1_9DIPT